jgi:glucose dehydrogenase
MLWDLLAVFAVVLGFLLIIGGLDTLITWRAWFLGISGLVLLLPGIIRICLRIRRLRTRSSSAEDKN